MQPFVFLKGMLVGLCGLVPGISGGTILFITGIYSRFIHAVSKFLSPKVLLSFLWITLITLFFPHTKNRKKFASFYKKYDLFFLFTLICGVLLASFAFSKLVLFLLINYFFITMMFFAGLILCSSFFIYRQIKDHSTSSRLFVVLGLLAGGSLLIISPSSVPFSYGFMILSGFFAISAMFLPGVSGSYVLYLLGSYSYVLEAIGSVSLITLFFFCIGVVLGAVIISRVVTYLLDKYYSKTLYFLFGFILGSLLLPLRDMVYSNFTLTDVTIGIVVFIVGFILVLLAERLHAEK